MTISLRWGAATDTGRVRSVNEDSALVEDGLFAVADGMGGHVAGEVASRVAIDALRTNAGQGLAEAVRLANRAVFERAVDDPSLRGMGTTMCAATLVEQDGRPQLLIANVGDSRVYVFRDGELVQLTDDHSLVGEMERDGRLTAEEAKVHPQRNIVTRVLGNEPDVEVDQFWLDPFRGDRLLLCSDGLFDMVDDDVMVHVLRSEPDANEAAAELVTLANEAGGRDNITVVLVDVVDDGGKAEAASASLAGTTTKSRPVERVVRDDEPAEPAPAPSNRRPRAGRATRHLTWRSALFVLALLAIVAGAAGGTWWFARTGYFVGIDRHRVTLFQGRPGGVLFLDPTVEHRTGLRLGDLPPARRAAVEDQHEFTTKAAAERFIDRLRQETTTTTTTTPGTTSTTVLPPTSAPTPSSTP